MFVKYFSKSGHRKTGDKVEGWNKWFLQWFFGRWGLAGFWLIFDV
jgi:hypothetical protein